MPPSPTSRRFLVGLLLAFVALSLADLLLTLRLIDETGGLVLESNPLAAWWLIHYGWAGMAGFKAALVLLITGLAGCVAWRRPRTGELLLVFACGAQSAVVL